MSYETTMFMMDVNEEKIEPEWNPAKAEAASTHEVKFLRDLAGVEETVERCGEMDTIKDKSSTVERFRKERQKLAKNAHALMENYGGVAAVQAYVMNSQGGISYAGEPQPLLRSKALTGPSRITD